MPTTPININNLQDNYKNRNPESIVFTVDATGFASIYNPPSVNSKWISLSTPTGNPTKINSKWIYTSASLTPTTSTTVYIGKTQNYDLISSGVKLGLYAASSATGVGPENYWKPRDADSTYSSAPYWAKISSPIAMVDFRAPGAYIGSGTIPIPRVDGAAAALRNGIFSRATLYAAASATTGAYILFGRSAVGKFGKGWGDHGSNYAPKLDFTARSNVNTKWDGKKFTKPTFELGAGLLEKVTPFRGDKVSVIDYRTETTLEDAYRWKPSSGATNKLLKLLDRAGLTSDFIKFYFTGPSILAGDTTTKDDIIVFRATIGSLQESYTAGWNPVQMIGRADPNYHYSSFNRDLSIDFTVYATDRDEMKPIYRKLNAMAGYMAPSYNTDTIGLTGPWMRMTIGDLFVQQPVIMTSLNYNLSDSDTTWEINIEDDPEMMQAPHRVNVSMGLTVIGDWVPQKGGTFYSLATKFDTGIAAKGDTNWLSDFKTDVDRDKPLVK